MLIFGRKHAEHDFLSGGFRAFALGTWFLSRQLAHRINITQDRRPKTLLGVLCTSIRQIHVHVTNAKTCSNVVVLCCWPTQGVWRGKIPPLLLLQREAIGLSCLTPELSARCQGTPQGAEQKQHNNTCQNKSRTETSTTKVVCARKVATSNFEVHYQSRTKAGLARVVHRNVQKRKLVKSKCWVDAQNNCNARVRQPKKTSAIQNKPHYRKSDFGDLTPGSGSLHCGMHQVCSPTFSLRLFRIFRV